MFKCRLLSFSVNSDRASYMWSFYKIPKRGQTLGVGSVLIWKIKVPPKEKGASGATARNEENLRSDVT